MYRRVDKGGLSSYDDYVFIHKGMNVCGDIVLRDA